MNEANAIVFLSYAREDRAFAERLATALTESGFSVWWDRNLLAGGRRFDAVIEEALRAARCVVVVWSAASLRSDWVRDEAEHGRRREILVPVNLGGVTPPLGFGTRNVVDDMRDWDGSRDDPRFTLVRRSISAVVRERAPGRRSALSPSTIGIAAAVVALLAWIALRALFHDDGHPAPTSVESPALFATSEQTALRVDPELDERGTVLVPPGKFTMGCALRECEDLPAPAYVGAFRIDVREVTVSQYRKCVDAKGCWARAPRMPSRAEPGAPLAPCNWDSGRDDHPMNCVTWNEASNYCAWRNPDARLPTEPEWEKAARGGTDDREYPWAPHDVRESPLTTHQHANVRAATVDGSPNSQPRDVGFDESETSSTVPVGSYLNGASPYGVLDMIGNVAEWTTPDGNDETIAAIRGGGWSSSADEVRISKRTDIPKTERRADLGFRCVRPLQENTVPTPTPITELEGTPTPNARAQPRVAALESADRIDLVKQMVAAAQRNGGLGDEETLGELASRLDDARDTAISPHRNRQEAKTANAIGREHLSEHLVTDAVLAFRDGYNADPFDVEIVNNFGHALVLDGKPGEAEQYLLRALMLSPRRANAWADLAQAYARLGDKRASVACFVNAYRWSRNPQQTRTFLERIARSNEDENVRASANSAIGLVAEMPRPGGSGR